MGETLADQAAVEALQEQQVQAMAEAELNIPGHSLESPENFIQTGPNPEEVITYQHADGTVRKAESVDALRGGVCPAMEGLSHKQVMLAMKMAARGKERLARQTADKAAQVNAYGKPKQHKEVKTVPKEATVEELSVRRSDQVISALRQHELTVIITGQSAPPAENKTNAQETKIKTRAESTKPATERPTNIVDIKARQESRLLLPTAQFIKKLTPVRENKKQIVAPKKPDAPLTVQEPLPAVIIQEKTELRLVQETAEVPNLYLPPKIETDTALERPKLHSLPEVDHPLKVGIENQNLMGIFVPESEAGQNLESVDSSEDSNYKIIVIEKVTEITAVSNETAEQATTLLVMLPEQIQASLKEYVNDATPELVEAVETQIVMISKVADRLHDLVINNESDSEEIARIEQWLTEQYTELLNTLGVDHDEEAIKTFIECIKSKDYVIDFKLLLSKELYDPMRERHGWSDLRGRQTSSNFTKLLRAELARFAVYHGLAASSNALAA